MNYIDEQDYLEDLREQELADYELDLLLQAKELTLHQINDENCSADYWV